MHTVQQRVLKYTVICVRRRILQFMCAVLIGIITYVL